MLLMMTSLRDAGPQLNKAAQLNPKSAQVWLDLVSYYQRTLQLEKAYSSRRRAVALAGDKAIEQDRSGLWRLAGSSIHPPRY